MTRSPRPPAPNPGDGVAPERRVDWGALEPADRARLDALRHELDAAARTLIGYPCSERFDYSELYPLLAYSLNNVGDPFASSNYRSNTHAFERDVLAEFAELVHAPDGESWGYVTSGGTEGNLYGLFLARELYPEGIVYYSEDTHYSVAKSLRLLHARSIMIRAGDAGELDYADLRESLRIHRDVPAIVLANAGTTMKGAVDDVSVIRDLLDELCLSEAYVHCDAALSGLVLPFVDEPPAWDFAAGADSISISGHKLLGAPVPCGVVLAKRRNVERIARSVEYVGVLDTTIGGSRSGLAPLFLWYALRRLGRAGLARLVEGCLEMAEYAVRRLEESGVPAWRHRHSLTVVFPRPAPAVIRRWQIAPYRDIGHLIAMPHVGREMIDAFVEDYLADPPTVPARCAAGPGSHLARARRVG